MSRGKPPAKAITMTGRQYHLLRKHWAKHSLSHHLKQRLSILLLAREGMSHGGIKRKLGVDINTIKKWRRRWESAYESVLAYESGPNGEGVSDLALLKRLLEVVQDEPRSGAPRRITLAQKKQIIALACEKPEDHGIALTQWNREMLAHVAQAKGIVDTISPRYVSEILKKRETPTS
ncbi:MAG: helix-turn-helix domain-containing protein [Bacteroidetes bacterium]|nr:helix-turn-helix domain-containing protein [Bacteroidota bacterium]MCB0844297.1 helix-turn-helix domain-containing protein [Bacteroidota bacterium]MCB0853258.1 helix-turn-helix domain-containing protein [Bacteroidota bacterium]